MFNELKFIQFICILIFFQKILLFVLISWFHQVWNYLFDQSNLLYSFEYSSILPSRDITCPTSSRRRLDSRRRIRDEDDSDHEQMKSRGQRHCHYENNSTCLFLFWCVLDLYRSDIEVRTNLSKVRGDCRVRRKKHLEFFRSNSKKIMSSAPIRHLLRRLVRLTCPSSNKILHHKERNRRTPERVSKTSRKLSRACQSILIKTRRLLLGHPSPQDYMHKISSYSVSFQKISHSLRIWTVPSSFTLRSRQWIVYFFELFTFYMSKYFRKWPLW